MLRRVFFMEEIDYIVVGLGIAGITFCEQLERHGHSFVVFDTAEGSATAIAGGTINPVMLKRFTPVWKATEFFSEAHSFYHEVSKKLNSPFVDVMPIHRILNDVLEQNNWLLASDTKKLSPFISSEIFTTENHSVVMPFGFGSVLHSFKLNLERMLKAYRQYLLKKECLISEKFDHTKLVIGKKDFQYTSIKAKQIVFAEGTAAIHNPYFSLNCLIPKKGEYIIFKAPQLRLERILKGAFFIIPLGNDLYKAGATFAHGDTSLMITSKGRDELVAAVKKMISCPFEVVDQVVGMRPTVKDRRPLLGRLLGGKPIFFNGLGTRGLFMAPLLAKLLYDYAENNVPLSKEIDINRFV
ncbi:MAG: FAD-dependent oxidoreductase [Bacteroidetes bacterium]|nr:MAG: FAD-dependent oxidoreductase [Bacteroidota bacterium]